MEHALRSGQDRWKGRKLSLAWRTASQRRFLGTKNPGGSSKFWTRHVGSRGRAVLKQVGGRSVGMAEVSTGAALQVFQQQMGHDI